MSIAALLDELRDINLIVRPDWSNPAAVLADLSPLLTRLFHHPAVQDITLLIDTQTLSEDLQDSANLLLLEVLLNISLETSVSEDLNVGLTGPLTPADWHTLQPWLNFHIALPQADQGGQYQPPIPGVDGATLFDPAVYHAAQLDSWHRWGNHFVACHLPQTAIPYYSQYLSHCPTAADIHLKLSEALWQTDQRAQAIQALEAGMHHCPDAPELHFWLIIRLKQNQDYPAAHRHAQTAAALFPADYTFKMLQALMLPEAYDTPAEIIAHRTAFQTNLTRLIQDIALDTPAEQKKALRAIAHHTNFFLSYQGYNDVALQQQYGQFLHRVMAANYPQWVQPRPRQPRPAKIRIGYLSAFLCGWSGTVLFLNWLKYADTDRFEIYTYHIGAQVDGVTELVKTYSTRFYHIQHNLEQVCQQVVDDRLQVLIFPELGMDATTLCIAGLRLAPIQCMAWGQPVTSGLPTLDYFLSSELMEPAQGQDHYTEALVRLPGVGISYPAISVPPVQRDRAAFGLREDSIVYLSSQAPYKYLPQHDAIYAQIACQVPNAQFMFLRAGIPQLGSIALLLPWG